MKQTGNETAEWIVVKRRRNSEWRAVMGADMREADAKAMAINLNRVNKDLGYYFEAKPDAD